MQKEYTVRLDTSTGTLLTEIEFYEQKGIFYDTEYVIRITRAFESTHGGGAFEQIKLPMVGEMGTRIHTHVYPKTPLQIKRIEVDFTGGVGSINIPSPLRGKGLGTFLFSILLKKVQKRLQPAKDQVPIFVRPLTLSHVDASEENRERRDRFYRALKWKVRLLDEHGNGEAYVDDLWELKPKLNGKIYKKEIELVIREFQR